MFHAHSNTVVNNIHTTVMGSSTNKSKASRVKRVQWHHLHQKILLRTQYAAASHFLASRKALRSATLYSRPRRVFLPLWTKGLLLTKSWCLYQRAQRNLHMRKTTVTRANTPRVSTRFGVIHPRRSASWFKLWRSKRRPVNSIVYSNKALNYASTPFTQSMRRLDYSCLGYIPKRQNFVFVFPKHNQSNMRISCKAIKIAPAQRYVYYSSGLVKLLQSRLAIRTIRKLNFTSIASSAYRISARVKIQLTRSDIARLRKVKRIRRRSVYKLTFAKRQTIRRRYLRFNVRKAFSGRGRLARVIVCPIIKNIKAHSVAGSDVYRELGIYSNSLARSKVRYRHVQHHSSRIHNKNIPRKNFKRSIAAPILQHHAKSLHRRSIIKFWTKRLARAYFTKKISPQPAYLFVPKKLNNLLGLRAINTCTKQLIHCVARPHACLPPSSVSQMLHCNRIYGRGSLHHSMWRSSLQGQRTILRRAHSYPRPSYRRRRRNLRLCLPRRSGLSRRVRSRNLRAKLSVSPLPLASIKLVSAILPPCIPQQVASAQETFTYFAHSHYKNLVKMLSQTNALSFFAAYRLSRVKRRRLLKYFTAVCKSKDTPFHWNMYGEPSAPSTVLHEQLPTVLATYHRANKKVLSTLTGYLASVRQYSRNKKIRRTSRINSRVFRMKWLRRKLCRHLKRKRSRRLKFRRLRATLPVKVLRSVPRYFRLGYSTFYTRGRRKVALHIHTKRPRMFPKLLWVPKYIRTRRSVRSLYIRKRKKRKQLSNYTRTRPVNNRVLPRLKRVATSLSIIKLRRSSWASYKRLCISKHVKSRTKLLRAWFKHRARRSLKNHRSRNRRKASARHVGTVTLKSAPHQSVVRNYAICNIMRSTSLRLRRRVFISRSLVAKNTRARRITKTKYAFMLRSRQRSIIRKRCKPLNRRYKKATRARRQTISLASIRLRSMLTVYDRMYNPQPTYFYSQKFVPNFRLVGTNRHRYSVLRPLRFVGSGAISESNNNRHLGGQVSIKTVLQLAGVILSRRWNDRVPNSHLSSTIYSKYEQRYCATLGLRTRRLTRYLRRYLRFAQYHLPKKYRRLLSCSGKRRINSSYLQRCPVDRRWGVRWRFRKLRKKSNYWLRRSFESRRFIRYYLTRLNKYGRNIKFITRRRIKRGLLRHRRISRKRKYRAPRHSNIKKLRATSSNTKGGIPRQLTVYRTWLLGHRRGFKVPTPTKPTK